MRFGIRFDTDNGAFRDGNEVPEVTRILQAIATKLENGCREGPVLDVNGNTVGKWGWTR